MKAHISNHDLPEYPPDVNVKSGREKKKILLNVLRTLILKAQGADDTCVL